MNEIQELIAKAKKNKTEQPTTQATPKTMPAPQPVQTEGILYKVEDPIVASIAEIVEGPAPKPTKSMEGFFTEPKPTINPDITPEEFFNGLDNAGSTIEDEYLTVEGTYKTTVEYVALKKDNEGNWKLSAKLSVLLGDHEGKIIWWSPSLKGRDGQWWVSNIKNIRQLFINGGMIFDQKTIAETPEENGKREFIGLRDAQTSVTVSFQAPKNGKIYLKSLDVIANG